MELKKGQKGVEKERFGGSGGLRGSGGLEGVWGSFGVISSYFL